MNLAPTELDPSRQVQPETLGLAPACQRLKGRRVLGAGPGQRAFPEPNPPVGNGRAISVLFAREGASVACVDMSEAAVNDTVAQVTKEGGNAFAEVADVRDAEAIGPLLRRCAERLGGLDALVLNVGISHALPLAQQTAAAWDEEYAVNVRSHMLFAQAGLEVMSPGSSIVLMSSLAAHRNTGRNPAYESSKAAQVALARAIAVAGEAKAIRCNAVCPALMTPRMGRDAPRRRPNRALAVPFGRQGTGWEVAYASLFLISHEASYVNATAMLVDGGLHTGVARA